MIERSHLPFCADIHIQTKKDPAEIWLQMLIQIPRLTEDNALGIVEDYPCFCSLMEAYEKAEREGRGGEDLLIDCKKRRTKAGTVAKNDRLGQALSRRVHTVFWGQDPLELVDKEHKEK
ncbi:hypothetical protein PM082_015145 [Marasmius tenuissimus]|nr:hypothetical protein PM082_015145 [Marasmius tenuissimus]